MGSGVTVANLFFGNVFGTAAKRALSVFIALRYAGSCFFDMILKNLTIPCGWGSAIGVLIIVASMRTY